MFVNDSKATCEDVMIFENCQIQVNISGLICDTPAKSLALKVNNKY